MSERIPYSHSLFTERTNTNFPNQFKGIRADELSAKRPKILSRNAYFDDEENQPHFPSPTYQEPKDPLDTPVERSPEELMAGGPASLYLQEISRHPLITPEREVTLAKQLEDGVLAKEQLAKALAEEETLAPEILQALEQQIAISDDARRRLIESNLRLVVSVARKYLGRGLPFLDLVQEGNIGLQRGVEKFDYRRGFRFSTYAYWWIRQAVSRAVAEQSRTIRLPVHQVEFLTKVYNAKRELNARLGKEPSFEEIGKEIDAPANKVEDAMRTSAPPISLEEHLSNATEHNFNDVVEDPTVNIAQEAEDTVFNGQLDKAIAERLTPREADVLRMRYGLDGAHERTLAEVGKELGISRERARQLEAEAMRKLRNNTSFSEEFRDTLKK